MKNFKIGMFFLVFGLVSCETTKPEIASPEIRISQFPELEKESGVTKGSDILYEEKKLVIPSISVIENLNSDNEVIEQIAKRILNDLGEFTPFHISRFFPHYKSFEHGIHNPTTIKSLKKAYEIAKNVGLKYVYLGNLPNPEYENTICPNCSKTVIKRVIFGIEESWIDSEGKCKICGFPICRI